METAGIRGTSRKKERRGRIKKDKRLPHFKTVRFGGVEENQMLCYLWDIVKEVEAALEMGKTDGTQQLEKLAKEMRRQIRVEIRRYFLRQRRRNVKTVLAVLAVILMIAGVGEFLIGVDRVSGNSMYPYLNHGDWILYSRLGTERKRNDVVVFERNGECLVKRIAGLPGDTVEISSSGSRVVVNGTQVREDYVTLSDTSAGSEKNKDTDRMSAPQKVMDGEYLVLGGNRGASIDSRDSRIGTVPEGEILGNVILVLRIR